MGYWFWECPASVPAISYRINGLKGELLPDPQQFCPETKVYVLPIALVYLVFKVLWLQCSIVLSLFPYGQLFLESWPLRFHNKVKTITASQGSERALQMMEKILPPLAGDVPGSYLWSFQSSRLLGHWSYLPMGTGRRRRDVALQVPKEHLEKLKHLKPFTQK